MKQKEWQPKGTTQEHRIARRAGRLYRAGVDVNTAIHYAMTDIHVGKVITLLKRGMEIEEAVHMVEVRDKGYIENTGGLW